jgi:hypothetical protein
MRVSDAWSQDVVLTAMCDDIARQRKGGMSPDFILATGDLAFSGHADEYKLVASFFDALIDAAGVPRDHIFCIPGNHDIDRERQKICFLGARHFAQNQNQIDVLLSPGEDLETLLKRQENYRNFQSSYLTGQNRVRTADGLGYVSSFTIEDLRIAIIGVDSAWLAEGGVSDHGKLLIGERQIINAIDLAGRGDPHIVIAMSDLEKDAQAIAATESQVSFSHTGALLEEIAAAGEWALLRTQAERHVDSNEPTLALQARRMLALSRAPKADTRTRRPAAPNGHR